MVAFMRQTRSGFKELTVGFKNQYDRLLAIEAQFSGLKLLNESPTRKKVTPRDLQVPTVTQPCAAEKLTPTTPSVQQLISFATPKATTAAGDADSVAEFIASENVQPSTPAASVSVVSASSLVVPSIPIPPPPITVKLSYYDIPDPVKNRFTQILNLKFGDGAHHNPR
ncbi:GL25500 [Drosophila persimilis]|uniref:GL25500 n=1 Tax=Drosophila persimilis TaxID=7234 RepID=B4HCY9_DROPE|nr:GL25500 [Drosophila persimilis]